MTSKYAQTHWGVRVMIALLIAASVTQSILLRQNSGHTRANACLVSVLVRSEYGKDQFTADQDYDEWRQGIVNEILECLEDYE